MQRLSLILASAVKPYRAPAKPASLAGVRGKPVPSKAKRSSHRPDSSRRRPEETRSLSKVPMRQPLTARVPRHSAAFGSRDISKGVSQPWSARSRNVVGSSVVTEARENRQHFDRENIRSPVEILSKAKERSDWPMKAYAAMLGNLGQAQSASRDAVFKPEELKLVIDPILSALSSCILSDLTDVASEMSFFVPDKVSEQVEAQLTPLVAALAKQLEHREVEQCPDSLVAITKALSFRSGLQNADHVRSVAAKKLLDSSGSLCTYNCTDVLLSIAQWPVDKVTGDVLIKILRRVDRLLARFTGNDAAQLFLTLSQAPAPMSNKDVSQRIQSVLVNEILRSWYVYDVDMQLRFLNIVGQKRHLLADGKANHNPNGDMVGSISLQRIRTLHKRLDNLAVDMEAKSIPSYLTAMALLRLPIKTLDALLNRFVDERLEKSSLRERIDAMWAMLRMGKETGSSAFNTTIKYTVKGKRDLILSDTTRLAKLYDIYVGLKVLNVPFPSGFNHPERPERMQEYFAQEWIDRMRRSEEIRVNSELKSKYGISIEEQLKGLAGDNFFMLNIKREVVVGDYLVPFYDEKQRIAIEIGPRNFEINFGQKAKNLAVGASVKLVVIENSDINGLKGDHLRNKLRDVIDARVNPKRFQPTKDQRDLEWTKTFNKRSD